MSALSSEGASRSKTAVFEPRDFVSDGNHVAVRLRVKLVMKKNGKSAEFDSIHFWTYDGTGKVSAY